MPHKISEGASAPSFFLSNVSFFFLPTLYIFLLSLSLFSIFTFS